MAKDKKKKKDKASKGSASKGGGALKAIAENPLVADVVAAALVATASALKDSKRARALAADVGDELGKLNKKDGDRGSALWDMALTIGKRSLAAMTADTTPASGGDTKKPKKSAAPKKRDA